MECTEKERALVEEAIRSVCDMDRATVNDVLQAQGVAWGGQRERLPSGLRAAAVAVVLERITPELKGHLRAAFAEEIANHKTQAKLRAGIPESVWSDLVKEIYPKDP